jgi:hypothetical protein
MANRPPDPNAIFLQAAAEEAVANAARARADVINTLADADYKQAGVAERNAKVVETISRIDEEDQRSTIEAYKGIKDILRG